MSILRLLKATWLAPDVALALSFLLAWLAPDSPGAATAEDCRYPVAGRIDLEAVLVRGVIRPGQVDAATADGRGGQVGRRRRRPDVVLCHALHRVPQRVRAPVLIQPGADARDAVVGPGDVPAPQVDAVRPLLQGDDL